MTTRSEFHYSEDVAGSSWGEEYWLIKNRDPAGVPTELERIDPADVTKVLDPDGEIIAYEIRRHG